MIARLLLDRDRAAVHVLGKRMTAEHASHLAYDRARADATIDRYLANANPTVFVADDRGEVCGFLVALCTDYAACAGFFVSQEIFYVRPDKRGTRAAAELATAFNRWADRLKPAEVFMGVATGHRPEVAARWMQRFGFEPAGMHMRRVVGR